MKNNKQQTAVEWLYSNLKSHFEHDGDLLEVVQFSFEQAKEMENVLESRNKKLETLARLLGKIWFYGEWKSETPNERVIQMLMQELGLYPFKDEDEMIQQTKVNDDLYKQIENENKNIKSNG